MSGFELNKIFAAILCVGITIMLSGFIADRVIVPEEMKTDAVAIEGTVVSGHGSPKIAKPKLPDPIMALLASADVAKGAKISKACAACHSFDKGGPVKQGPNLWNALNRPKASTSGFKYSDGLQTIGGLWDYDSLNKFLAKPKKYAPGTKMNFAGLKKPKHRAALIAWLRQQADTPEALPSESDIAAEQAAFAPPVEEHVEAVEGMPVEEGIETETHEEQPAPEHH